MAGVIQEKTPLIESPYLRSLLVCTFPGRSRHPAFLAVYPVSERHTTTAYVHDHDALHLTAHSSSLKTNSTTIDIAG
jgi:hypothetical protein